MHHRSVLFGFALLLSVCLLPSSTLAQYEDTDDVSQIRGALQDVGQRYAGNYVQPVTDAFGAGISSGLFRTADVGNGFIPGLPIDVYLGVSVSGTFTSSMKTSFIPQSEPVDAEPPSSLPGDPQAFLEFNPPDESVPTVLGPTETPNTTMDLVFRDENGDELDRETIGPAPPGLLDTKIAPIAVPQLGIGAVAGTDLQVRYFPKSELSGGGGSYGKVGLFGIAVRHDLDQWFPTPLPLNIAVQGAWNRFSLESKNARASDTEFSEVVNASGWAFNLQASRGIPILPVLVYGGVQLERFNAEYTYSFQPTTGGGSVDPIEITLDQDAENTFRGLAGLSISFPPTPLRLNVDYAIGNANNVVTAGLGVRL